MGKVINLATMFRKNPHYRKALRGRRLTAEGRVLLSNWRVPQGESKELWGRRMSRVFGDSLDDQLLKVSDQKDCHVMSTRDLRYPKTDFTDAAKIKGSFRIDPQHDIVKILYRNTQNGIPYHLVYDEKGVLLKNGYGKPAPHGTVLTVTREYDRLDFKFYNAVAGMNADWVNTNPYYVEGVDAVEYAGRMAMYVSDPSTAFKIAKYKKQSKERWHLSDYYAFSFFNLTQRLSRRVDQDHFYACVREAFICEYHYLRMDTEAGDLFYFEKMTTYIARVMTLMAEDMVYFDWTTDDGLVLVPHALQEHIKQKFPVRLRRQGRNQLYVEVYDSKAQLWRDGRFMNESVLSDHLSTAFRELPLKEMIYLNDIDPILLGRYLLSRTVSAFHNYNRSLGQLDRKPPDVPQPEAD